MSRPTWFVVYTGYRAEGRAEVMLAAKGFEVFCPRATVWITHARKRERAGRVLFQRYLFAACEDPDGWASARRVDGVDAVITTAAGTPLLVDATVIDDLWRRQMEGEFDYTQEPEPLKPGDSVEVIAGKLAGWQAVIERIVNDGRVELTTTTKGFPARCAVVELSQIEARKAA